MYSVKVTDGGFYGIEFWRSTGHYERWRHR
jgi:hypothetical protein